MSEAHVSPSRATMATDTSPRTGTESLGLAMAQVKTNMKHYISSRQWLFLIEFGTILLHFTLRS